MLIDIAQDVERLTEIPPVLDISAVALGAVQGAVFATRMAEERRIDITGIVIIGIASGLGGGIMRDLLLNVTPVTLRNPAMLTTAITAALLGMALAPAINRIERLVVAVDAAALGMYLMVGLATATDRRLGVVPTVFVGVIACTGGSVIRDTLLQTQVAIVRVGSFYSFAAILGAVAYSLAYELSTVQVAGIAAVGVTFASRMAAVRWGWRAPRAQVLNTRALRKLARQARPAKS
ncbi:MAG TPA: TRIC cation channel family protein [Acidimicrobiales bacterium]